MSLEEDMKAAAVANANIDSLIDGRFYANSAPAVARPLIEYTHINSDGERSLGGVFVERWAQYQWRLVCDSYEEIVQLKTAVNELAGTSASGISKIDVRDGPDGYDFETKRFARVMYVYLTK